MIAVGRTGIALIPIGYGLSTKLWHMVLSECIGYGLLGAGNLATQNAAMDDIFSSNPGATARFPLVDCSCTHGRPSDDCAGRDRAQSGRPKSPRRTCTKPNRLVGASNLKQRCRTGCGRASPAASARSSAPGPATATLSSPSASARPCSSLRKRSCSPPAPRLFQSRSGSLSAPARPMPSGACGCSSQMASASGAKRNPALPTHAAGD